MTGKVNKWFLRRTRFHRQWKEALSTEAKVFTGLYTGLRRVAEGTAKKPGKILKEWCTRTEYKFGESKVDEICKKRILPLTQDGSAEACAKTAARLLLAAEAAGIRPQEAGSLVLTDELAGAYISLDDEELFGGDEIVVVTPAWFQNGMLIEQGYCNKKQETE